MANLKIKVDIKAEGKECLRSCPQMAYYIAKRNIFDQNLRTVAECKLFGELDSMPDSKRPLRSSQCIRRELKK